MPPFPFFHPTNQDVLNGVIMQTVLPTTFCFIQSYVIFMRQITIPIILVLIILSGAHAGASMAILPQVQLPLAPLAENPPFDDEAFFNLSNSTITHICNKETLPVGRMNTAFYDSLAATYYSLIRMNVSEENYPKAEKIISFLSYTLTLAEQYSDYEKEKEKFSPVDMGLTSYEDLELWYDAAFGVWKTISPGYPDARMYGMPSSIEPKSWTVGQFPVV